ncbi:conserved Plasmodium protein, unknown function [Plasmodium relictum]|uniref:Histone RNA hairpin-binding protein RNA-binding domain-containing protein n=1 Tax=Plasmodium relictum TaxID=85471 RepID=A0A1J1H7U2_PLARL|nr:conserved Plasmodium protein, unknown function [Plasmodium relictum]CRG99487.1 conserved Plasmodium protein, unknown function [Plasmodium relictum]
MSTIRWVDLLSSESNFSHSIANNDDINDQLKKKKINNKKNDLNNSFLNSYNGDLDNSNVGINLKIKNMCITDNKEKKGEFADTQTNKNDNVNKIISNNEKKNIEKEPKDNKEINGNQLLHKDDNANDYELDNKIKCKMNDEKNEERVTNNNNSNKIHKEKIEQINEKNENKDLNVYNNKDPNIVSKDKNNNNSNYVSKMNKKKNSSNSSDSKVNKNKKIINVPLDQKTVKNSFFSKYIIEKKGKKNGDNNLDESNSVATPKNVNKNKIIEENENNSLINNVESQNADTISKCKKRKDRNLNIDNSISKFDYTQSHEVTVDENNIPLNPTKKVKNRLKENVNDNKKSRNDDDIISSDFSKNNEMKTNLKGLDLNKKISEEEKNNNNNFKKIDKNNSIMDPFNNMINKNINLEKFNNFNNNFISYIGDIRNNFNESLNNVNSNRVSSRLKEIAVGKSTKEYKNYVKLVRYDERMEDDPSTPNAYENITNAKFQAKYNLWRKKLHKFDTIN